MIQAKELRKVYNNGQGVQSISLEIQAGEFVGVLGHSGAGKTTFMRMLCGAIFPINGQLTVLGQDMTNISHANLLVLRRRIATVYQTFNVIPSLDVARNVLLGRMGQITLVSAVRKLLWLRSDEQQEIQQLLSELGIGDKMFERGQELSGGQQQRVAIARALYSNADLVLADEPIASVDPATATVILDQFQALQRRGKTVIMNLHQVSSALQYCSRLIMLDEGRIVYDDLPERFEATDTYRQLMGSRGEKGVCHE